MKAAAMTDTCRNFSLIFIVVILWQQCFITAFCRYLSLYFVS